MEHVVGHAAVPTGTGTAAVGTRAIVAARFAGASSVPLLTALPVGDRPPLGAGRPRGRHHETARLIAQRVGRQPELATQSRVAQTIAALLYSTIVEKCWLLRCTIEGTGNASIDDARHIDKFTPA